MLDQINSKLVTSFIVFIHDFADPSEISKKDFEESLGCKIEDLFKRQRTADLAKKKLGEEFNKAIALYFNRFQTKDGFNHRALTKALLEDEPTLVRYLKKDAVRYVKLLAGLMEHVDTKPKGLLAS